MFAQILSKIFGTANERFIKSLRSQVAAINALEPRIMALSDEELTAQTSLLREKLSQGARLDDLLPEAFATVREASRRVLGQRHYDVQLVGGIVLHQGKIAEMKTGEGKTLTATLALYLNALAGKGAHLVTVNDYLARRDAAWMGPVFQKLGLTVGCIQNSMDDAERKQQYAADILYATNNELGFDYLRDNMKFRLEDYVQRPLHYAIVDEVDSILIDEARTPLIISGASDESSRLYSDADRVVKTLKKETDYTVDEKDRQVHLTEPGIDKIEAAFKIPNLYALENLKILHHISQALRAHALFKKDVEYIVHDDEVLIVDEFTGRILQGRRYSDGLHQALEAKEGVTIERETQTLASITLQNFFRLYKKLAGMTGTAATEAEEFHNIYKLDVISIPTNRPMVRTDKDDLIFLTKDAKYKSIVKDIQERHKIGQPVLIGTIAVETSEYLSTVLTAHGIQHDVLNAKQHAREADIVAHAGEPGHITIATNMAGRGTDIKLTPESVKAGGLYILGTERHESRRIDNQLRGRSGRQGDPGESRFYISLDDEMIRIYSGDSMKKTMEKAIAFENRVNEMMGRSDKNEAIDDIVIEAPSVSKAIAMAQERMEKSNFDRRKNLLEYDDVLNQQRIVIYRYRHAILEGAAAVADLVHDMISDTVSDVVAHHTRTRTLSPEIAEAIISVLSRIASIEKNRFEQEKFPTDTIEALTPALISFIMHQYEKEMHPAGHLSQEERVMRELLLHDAHKWLMLETLDGAWKQHMLNLDNLKEGIWLRGMMGQKNPLLEYKREAFAMFEDMMKATRAEVVHHLFHLKPEEFDARAIQLRRERELQSMQLKGTGDSVDADAHRGHNHAHGHHGHNHDHHGHDHKNPSQIVQPNKPGRNDICPCGSGKKFKKCCGK